MSTSVNGPVFQGTSRHPADCQPPCRVVIGDAEVPTVNGQDGNPPSVEVQMRKTGVSDLTRVADLLIPYEWIDGGDVFSVVTQEVESGGVENSPFVGELEGFRRFGNGPVRIDILDPVTDSYVNVFHGAINNAGPSTLDGVFRLMCIGWSNYFDRIAVDLDVKANGFSTALRGARDAINEHEGIPDFELGIFTDIEGAEETFEEVIDNLQVASLRPSIQPIGEVIADLPSSTPQKSFHKYEHTAADVLDWVTSVTGTQWYTELTADGPTIVVDDAVQGPALDGRGLFEDSYSSGDVGVIANNALFQLGPTVSLGGRGKKTRVEDSDDDPIDVVSGGMATTTVIPEVVVQHDRLAAIAGPNPNPRYIETNASDLSTLESKVRTELKRSIDDAAGGQMLTLPAPLARPYGTITAKPACNGRLSRSIPDVTYEIEEVIHRIVNPTVDTSEGPRTTIRCGIGATSEDFSVQSKQLIELD